MPYARCSVGSDFFEYVKVLFSDGETDESLRQGHLVSKLNLRLMEDSGNLHIDKVGVCLLMYKFHMFIYLYWKIIQAILFSNWCY